MLYLSIFFICLCGLTYLALTAFFESYYTQSRTNALMEKTKEVAALYDQAGLTPELQALIDQAEEEGTVIQIIQAGDNSTETSQITVDSTATLPVATGQVADTLQNKKVGSWESIIRLAAENGSGAGADNGEHAGSAAGSGNGEGKNAGAGSQNASGKGQGYGQTESIANQAEVYQEGESFVMILGNADHQVEWLSCKEVAADGAQIVGRIPLTSVSEVIAIVQKFLLAFLAVIFACSLVFAFFFASGISKPIVLLNRIATEMGNLNFAEKYRGKRKDEIGQLGKTLNHISDELELTIARLQDELNKERTLEKMRQRFTAQVSHEIQTPLAIIKSHAEALEDGIPENREEEMEYFMTIQKEADKISGIASDLLDLSQMESGVYRLKREKNDGFAVLAAVVERFRHAYQEKDIRLTNRCEAGQLVDFDRKRMEQVFYNLLSNAIKHVYPTDGIIAVACERQADQWLVSVYNTGDPIAEEEQDQIWKYFYKGETDTKGTGLGLAIVKGIMQCHGGTVAIKNWENGVRFEVALPLTPEHSKSGEAD
jgi:signal transduction histidine kinase